MSRHDNLWQDSSLTGADTPDSVLKRFQFLDNDKSIRYSAEYTNTLFLAAGEATAHVRGTTWSDLLQKTILDPLGMKDTYPTLASVPESAKDRLSTPFYDYYPFADYFSLDPVAPAGSIVSTAGDMAKWLTAFLDQCNGKDSGPLLSCANAQKIYKGNIPFGNYNPDFGMYGLGMWTEPYPNNQKPGITLLAHHGGNSIGFTSHVGFLPVEGYGVAILVNEQLSSATDALLLKIVDMILKQNLKDWDALMGAAQAAARDGLPQKIAQNFKNLMANPVPMSLDMDKYTGTYKHPSYGELKISLAADGKSLQLVDTKGVTLKVAHVSGDTFLLGDIPDFVADPTKIFRDVPQQIQFLIIATPQGLLPFGLRSTFDPKVAPITFTKVMLPNQDYPPFWLNFEQAAYPVGF